MSASSDYLRVLTDITREGGATRAATQRANSQIWGNAVAKLGDFASDTIKQYAVDKKAKKAEKWEQDLSDLFKRSADEYKAQQEPSMSELTGGLSHMTMEQRATTPYGGANVLGIPPGNDLPQQGGITGTQFGQRADGTPKGSGYFGALSRPDGSVSSEISIGINVGGKEVEVPALVPTLTPEEKNWLLTNDISDPSKIPPTIVQKAADFARQRMAAGQSPFAGPSESPRPSSFTGPELKNARPPRQSPFPTPSEILALGQPLNGIKVIDGLAALQKLNPQDSEEAKVKRMQAVYRGLDTMSEADRAAAFPGVIGAFEQVYGTPFGDKTYTPEKWKAIGAGLQVGPKESTAQPTEWSFRGDLSSKDPDVRARAQTALDSAAKTPKTDAFNSWNEVEIAASNPTDPRHDNAVAMLQNRPAGADSMSGPEADEKYRRIVMKPPKARTPEDAAWAEAYKQQKTMVPAATFQMNAPVRETGREDKTYDRQTARIDKVVGPIRDQLTRINKLSSTLNQMTPTADALIAPELLTAMAGGMGSGLRMNEAEISRIVGGRSNWETLKSKLNQWSLDPSKALSITDEQRKEMRSLVKEVQRQAQDKVRSLSKASSDLDNASSVDEMRKIANKALQGLEDEATAPNSTTGGLPAVGDTFQGGTVRKVTRLP